jgi:hypothetical protein
MDHKVLQKKLRRTTYSYIEIQQIHTKEHHIHTNRYSSSDSSKETLDTYEKIPAFIQEIQQVHTKIQDAYNKKKQKRPQNLADLVATGPDPTDLGRPCHGGARWRCIIMVELNAGGRWVEHEAGGWSSRPAGGARGRRWAELKAVGGGRGGSIGVEGEAAAAVAAGWSRWNESR